MQQTNKQINKQTYENNKQRHKVEEHLPTVEYDNASKNKNKETNYKLNI